MHTPREAAKILKISFLMNRIFLWQRQCSSLATLNSTQTLKSKELKILHYCKSASLHKALHILNSLNFTKLSNKPFVYASLLQTSTKIQSFNHGLQIHAHVIKSGLEVDRFVGNSLLSLYYKLDSDSNEARKVFDGLFHKDVVSWTSMITGYVQNNKPKNSIELFLKMVAFDVEPNGFTLSAVIKACSSLRELKLGKCFHGLVIVRGFESNHVIATALVDMYGRNGELNDSCQMFDELSEPDAIGFTSIISALTRNDMYDKALEIFYVMQRKHGLLPDDFTFGTVLTACGNLKRLKQGKEVHSKIISSGFGGNVVAESSLVDMYAKCKLIIDSQRVFDRMIVKNAVSWSALLGGYCQCGDYKSVIRIFRQVEYADVYNFGTVLRACAGLASIRHGKEVHCQYLRRGGLKDIIVESALVDLYAKCGRIDLAHIIFLQMPVRNLITWNSMISGFAQNGRGDGALAIFEEMIKAGIKPDYISFIGVLSACSHTGIVDQGRNYFTSMSKVYGIKPGIEHYNCMVDLLGRAGLLEEAEHLIEHADCRDDSSLWQILLGACATCANFAVAERIAKKAMESEPLYHLSYVYLANIYRAVGRWEDAMEITRLMQERGVKKTAGKSWIEAKSNKNTCVAVGDV